jgi:hypothetical protein
VRVAWSVVVFRGRISVPGEVGFRVIDEIVPGRCWPRKGTKSTKRLSAPSRRQGEKATEDQP